MIRTRKDGSIIFKSYLTFEVGISDPTDTKDIDHAFDILGEQLASMAKRQFKLELAKDKKELL